MIISTLSKLVKPSSLAMALSLLASGPLLLGCTLFGFGTPAEINPTVKIVSPAHGAVIKQGPKLFIKIETTNFKYANGLAKKSAAQSGAINGKVLLYLDRSSDFITDTIAVLATSDSVTLDTVLSIGEHYIVAAGSTPDNPDTEGMSDTTTFTVTAP